MTYTDIQNFCPFQMLDIRFQVDHVKLKIIQLFEDSKGDLANARISIILTRRRKNKLVSDGKKITTDQFV